MHHFSGTNNCLSKLHICACAILFKKLLLHCQNSQSCSRRFSSFQAEQLQREIEFRRKELEYRFTAFTGEPRWPWPLNDLDLGMMLIISYHNSAIIMQMVFSVQRYFSHISKPCSHWCNGSCTLAETDLGTDSDLDSKPDDYILLWRTYSRWVDLDSDPYSLFVCRTGIRVRVRTRVHLWQGKWAVTVAINICLNE